jgi:hypothetical protein
MGFTFQGLEKVLLFEQRAFIIPQIFTVIISLAGLDML